MTWEEPKKNGEGTRPLSKALDPLCGVQSMIKGRILDRVVFPPYLQGGVRDRDNPRDPVRNAEIHENSWVQVEEDMTGYFRHVTRGHIYDVWRRFFGFSPDAARSLTALTIRDNQLPQGASTSQALANLVFWRYEANLVAKLGDLGFRYSRFTDDVTLSRPTRCDNQQISQAKALLRAFFGSHGFKLSRSPKKSQVQRRKNRMVCTGHVNNKKVSVASEVRSRVRRDVKRLEILAMKGFRNSTRYCVAYRSVSGQVSRIQRLHPKPGAALRERLSKIRPTGRPPAKRKRGAPVWDGRLLEALA